MSDANSFYTGRQRRLLMVIHSLAYTYTGDGLRTDMAIDRLPSPHAHIPPMLDSGHMACS